MSALRADKWSAKKLRKDTRSVLRTMGIMTQEIARLAPENRVIRSKRVKEAGGRPGEEEGEGEGESEGDE